ncbi:hypothetical protein HYX01_04805 [Candidatus Woesearchaeota archaeon]|nr:hypothetical protein [Candidatus Woesearchaeota archaeon]
MGVNERIISLIKEKGPILPVQAAKEINENILMASARLSELIASKHLKISSLKVGGSPLYYLPGQEEKLQNFVNSLREIEKKAFLLLRQEKLLEDSLQEPAIRVALRNIQDFSVPLQVTYNNKNDIFWKWYLLGNKEAETLINNLLSKKEQRPQEETKTDELQLKDTQKDKAIKEESKKDASKKYAKTADKTQFLREIISFFNKNNIQTIETIPTKKNFEADFIIELSTPIGNIKYFCKSKNKKIVNDADLSSAAIQAQSKNLPLFFLTNGNLTKQAKEMLNNELKNIAFKTL